MSIMSYQFIPTYLSKLGGFLHENAEQENAFSYLFVTSGSRGHCHWQVGNMTGLTVDEDFAPTHHDNIGRYRERIIST